MSFIPLHSPAAERNAPAILTALMRLLPPAGTLLEVASGSGQHVACFAASFPAWTWQPTDFDAQALSSIQAWCQGLANVRAPVQLDVLVEPWPAVLPTAVDAMFVANLFHIAPWACTAAVMRGAAQRLAPKGLLITYGPYLEDDVPTAASNLAFDADLRARHPAWGLRRLHDVASTAQAAGLVLRERIAMPANNLLLVWVHV